jgi:hypothetical protein
MRARPRVTQTRAAVDATRAIYEAGKVPARRALVVSRLSPLYFVCRLDRVPSATKR